MLKTHSTQNFTSKLPSTGTTIFTIMSQMAQEYNAINLAQGFPDFEMSEELISLVHRYMLKGHNQYAPMPGILPLREKISTMTGELYGYTPDPVEEITLTCGATEACYVAITSVVKPGDEVILFEPAFDCYVAAIELCGAKPVYIQMDYPDYKIDWQQVSEKTTGETRLIILNSPHNPTGSVISQQDIHALQSIIEKNDIFLLSDEVYEHIIFDKLSHESILKYEAIRNKSFVISSLGKTFHCTGWRVGYCIAPAYLTKEFRKVHQYNTFSVHTPTQYAIAEYLDDKENYLHLSGFFQKKRDTFIQRLSSSRFELIPAKGSYFQLVSYRNISDEKDIDFAARITKEFKVASIPVSPFYHDNRDDKIIRFCFAKKDETLERATEILCKI
jgi:methionine aminotransferase